MKGIVKKLVSDKGFGFLTVEGRSKDLFFHATEMVGGFSDFKSLLEGDEVTFEDIVNSGKGDSATGVSKVY